MTISREPGDGAGASVKRLVLLVREARARAVRSVRRRVTSAGGWTAEDVSFEVHVDQALNIIRQVPAMRVAPAAPVASVTPVGAVRRAVRS